MIKIFLSVVAAIIVTGCATPASYQAMSIGIQDVPSSINAKLKGSMVVASVDGGKDTSPLWTSQVDNQNFKSALEQSLIAVGYRSQDPNSAKYVVKAVLQELDQPLIGMTFDVRSTVLYSVTNQGAVQSFPITAVGSATMSEALIGIERLRIASEKSIKENLKQFIQKISDFYR